MTTKAVRIHLLLTLLLLLLIPVFVYPQDKKIEKSAKVVMIQGREYYLHKVQKGQTLYSISKTYNVSLELIYQENKEVEQGIKTGQEIKIPVHAAVITPVPAEKPAETAKPTTDPVKAVTKAEQPVKDSVQKKPAAQACKAEAHPEVFNIALMLPLYLAEIDSIQVQQEQEPALPGSYKSLRFIQFYEGMLIALDSLEKAGFSCKLNVYDVDEDSLKVKKILKKPEMEKMDMIIGLLYGNIFGIVSQFAAAHEIILVNPLSNKHAYIENKPKVILANPTVNEMSVEIARFILASFGDDNVILLSPVKDNEKKSYVSLKENLKTLGNQKNLQPELFKEHPVTGITNTNLLPVLVKNKRNFLVLLSNDELLVSNLMRQVKMLDPEISVVLFGMPGWADFKSLESHDLVNYNFHTYANSFIDYQDADVKAFLQKFREKYATEPEENAFQGYDIAFYFCSALLAFGNNFEPCLPEFRQKSLSTNYKYNQHGKDGIENTYLNIVNYQDYLLHDARK